MKPVPFTLVLAPLVSVFTYFPPKGQKSTYYYRKVSFWARWWLWWNKTIYQRLSHCKITFQSLSADVHKSSVSVEKAAINIWQMKWREGKSLSRVRLSATPWTAAYKAPLSMGFSRHSLKEWPCSPNVAGVLVFKYWSEGPERSQVLWVVDSRICVLCVVCLCVSVCVCLCVSVCVYVWTRGMNLFCLQRRS